MPLTQITCTWKCLAESLSYQATVAVLIQEHPHENGKMIEMPIAYFSAQFPDTQFKWSTVVKEGYVIYHAIKNGDIS